MSLNNKHGECVDNVALKLYKKKELDVATEHDKPSTNIMHVQYLFVIFLITLDVICSQRPQANPGLSEKDKKIWHCLKRLQNFKKSKQKLWPY
ncbi:hypothetical protein MS3_00010624 [Schistosoma haematobium]|uniref:Uncharacterized protein n=1 Tax=Schistosoma haematobium TaxID=6185 RepID=A0A922LKC2_SCHHA|nr:hypothetical protein MS3_00010624 [Schistosoma haematobium]KAH9587835.1 hypothetical protein MS3_00010624 [Schistosoma haematobium]